MNRRPPSPFEAVLRRTRLPEDGEGDEAVEGRSPVRSTPWYVPQTAFDATAQEMPQEAGFAARYETEQKADTQEPVPEPASVDPAEIAIELDLAGCGSVEALRLRRRRFAQANHPDMLHPALRRNGTERMMIANRLVDQEIARRRRFRPQEHDPER